MESGWLMSVVKALWLGSTVILIAGCQSWQYRDIEDLPPTAALPDASEPGVVEVRYFDNLPGTDLATLTDSPQYPDNPDEVTTITSLQIPGYRAEDYGTFVRGFIQPPQSGDYRFLVSGNDKVDFWLSTDDSATNAKVIASVPSYTNQSDFTKYTSQTSPYVTLDASKRYYFQVHHKEGSGSDHFTVTWEGPGMSQQVVDSAYIFSWAEPSMDLGDGQSSQEAYNLGYRVGFVDGTEGLVFNPGFPPADQDQDGLYDNWEIVNGLNPNDPNDANSDPDGDFLVAADEFLIGTSENKADTDGDGIPDGAEFAYQLDPLSASDANGDIDNDGYSNLEEYLAGTALDNPESMPAAPEPEPEPIPEPTPTMISGFTGQYFIGTDFDTFVLARNDKVIDFDWGRGQPMPELPDNKFSVRWTGEFSAPHTSGNRDYQFLTTTNDGVRLYLNGQTVIDDWRGSPTRDNSYTLTLGAGEQVRITMENYEGTGSAFARLTIIDTSSGSAVSPDGSVATHDLSSTSTQDSDSDGIPDVWELGYGLNAYISDATAVNNSSGITNLEAYESSLHPFTLETVASGGGGSEPDPVAPPPPEPAAGEVTLSWTAPGTRVDGSSISLSEIDYYQINYGESAGNLNQEWPPVSGENSSATITGLSAGTWYFTVTVVDNAGLKSAPSDMVSATVQ